MQLLLDSFAGNWDEEDLFSLLHTRVSSLQPGYTIKINEHVLYTFLFF
jgi:hypothetical protein